MKSVYCPVRTEYLNKAVYASYLKGYTDQMEELLRFVFVDCIKGPRYVEMDDILVHRPKGKFVRMLTFNSVASSLFPFMVSRTMRWCGNFCGRLQRWPPTFIFLPPFDLYYVTVL